MIATSTTWGKGTTNRQIKVNGLVRHPGTTDNVAITVTGHQSQLGGDMLYAFEAIGPTTLVVRSGCVFRTQKAAQDAAEVFAQHLLDFAARMPRPAVPKIRTVAP